MNGHLHCRNIFAGKAIGRKRYQHTRLANGSVANNYTLDRPSGLSHNHKTTLQQVIHHLQY